MIKLSNLFLLIFLGVLADRIEGMHGHNRQTIYTIDLESGSFKPISSLDQLIINLNISIYDENAEAVKDLIKEIKNSGIDLNELDSLNRPLLYYIFVNFVDKPSEFKLKVIEYFIQNGVNLNNTYFTSLLDTVTPLEEIIYYISEHGSSFSENKLQLYYKLINLLLGYGENITEKAKELAGKSKYSNELLKILNHHQDIINQAQTNPTENLLLEAVGYNKPYIVKLIMAKRPELASRYYVALAKLSSPFSAPTLKRALGIQKFRESELVQQRLPIEVVERIERFVPNK